MLASHWPLWRGDTVAIVASGPSAKRAGLDQLRGRARVIAIKQSIDLCLFADVVYGCDAWWWKHRNGLPEFNGLKLAWADRARSEYPDLHQVRIPNIHCDRLLLEETGAVGSGGNSGFQALNLAVQFGAARILLIGFDMDGRGGLHWYGRNAWPRANNPDETNFERWRAAFAAAAPQLTERGVDVVNCSPSSALTCFPRSTIEQALTGLGQ